MNNDNKMAGSVIFKLVGGILGALVACITAIGVAIFRAVENPTGDKKDASLLGSLMSMFKSSEKKGGN